MANFNFFEDEEDVPQYLKQSPQNDMYLPQTLAEAPEIPMGNLQQNNDMEAILQGYRDRVMRDIANNQRNLVEAKSDYATSQEAGSGWKGGIAKGLSVLGDVLSAGAGKQTDYTQNVMKSFEKQREAGAARYDKAQKSGLEYLSTLGEIDKKKMAYDMANPNSDISKNYVKNINENLGLKIPEGTSFLSAQRMMDLAVKQDRIKKEDIWKATEFAIKREAIQAQKESKSEKPATSEQNLAAGYAARMEEAQGIFDELEGKGYDPTSRMTQMSGILPTEMQSENKLRQEAAEKNFITAVLRKESGANIPPAEYTIEKEKYFGLPGEPPKVLEDKRRLRQQSIENLKAAGGPAYEKIKKVGDRPKPSGPPVGTIEDGHRFLGGNPSDANNWEQVQ